MHVECMCVPICTCPFRHLSMCVCWFLFHWPVEVVHSHVGLDSIPEVDRSVGHQGPKASILNQPSR